MLSKRIIAVAVAALGLAGPVTALAQAPSADVPREDRRNDQRAEANVNVPRNADGSIDVQGLTAEIKKLFDGSVRHVRIREQGLTPQDRQQLMQLAQQLADSLGLERVRIRQDDGRVRIDLRSGHEDRAEKREDRHEDRREDRREDRMARGDRRERAERPERVERPERMERVERPDRSGRN